MNIGLNQYSHSITCNMRCTSQCGEFSGGLPELKSPERKPAEVAILSVASKYPPHHPLTVSAIMTVALNLRARMVMRVVHAAVITEIETLFHGLDSGIIQPNSSCLKTLLTSKLTG